MMKSYKISDEKQRQTNLNDEKLHISMKNEGKRNESAEMTPIGS